MAKVGHRFSRRVDDELWRDVNDAWPLLAKLVPNVVVIRPESGDDAAKLQDDVIASVFATVHPGDLAERAFALGMSFVDVTLAVRVADLLELVLTEDARTPHFEQRFEETMRLFESARESFVRAIDRFAERLDRNVTSPVVGERAAALRKSAAVDWRRDSWRTSTHEGMRQILVALTFPPERPKTAESCTPSPEEQPLFAEILDHPDDDALRSKWAEIVSARDEARAALVREQLRMRARRRACGIDFGESEVERHVLSNHPEWADDVRRLGADVSGFYGGFVEHVTIRADAFLENGAKLLRTAPIRRVRLTDAASHLDALFASGLVDRLLWLDLSGQNLDDTHAEKIARASSIGALRGLSLESNQITDRGLRALWASPIPREITFCLIDQNPCSSLDSWELTPQEMSHYEWVPTDFAVALEAELGRPRLVFVHTAPHLDLLDR